jgi:hypothetical protein
MSNSDGVWSMGDSNLPRQSCAVNVKRQIRISNREVEVEELYGWSLFGFTECLIQDVTPKPNVYCRYCGSNGVAKQPAGKLCCSVAHYSLLGRLKRGTR